MSPFYTLYIFTPTPYFNLSPSHSQQLEIIQKALLGYEGFEWGHPDFAIHGVGEDPDLPIFQGGAHILPNPNYQKNKKISNNAIEHI